VTPLLDTEKSAAEDNLFMDNLSCLSKRCGAGVLWKISSKGCAKCAPVCTHTNIIAGRHLKLVKFASYLIGAAFNETHTGTTTKAAFHRPLCF
jgi:hypothetical protein